MQQQGRLKLAQTERLTICTCKGSRMKWGSYACWILTVELIFRKYNHLHNAQFPRLSPHRDLDLPTQTCSPAPVGSLMHMALAGLLAKCQCICSFAWCLCMLRIEVIKSTSRWKASPYGILFIFDFVKQKRSSDHVRQWTTGERRYLPRDCIHPTIFHFLGPWGLVWLLVIMCSIFCLGCS